MQVNKPKQVMKSCEKKNSTEAEVRVFGLKLSSNFIFRRPVPI